MILQSHGMAISVERRGYPDTEESFSGGGFVTLTHTNDDGRSYSTNHAKETFARDSDGCLEEHWSRTHGR